MLRVQGPFEVLERVHDNAYKIELPGDFQVITDVFGNSL